MELWEWSEEEQTIFLSDMKQRTSAILDILVNACPSQSIRRRVWSTPSSVNFHAESHCKLCYDGRQAPYGARSLLLIIILSPVSVWSKMALSMPLGDSGRPWFVVCYAFFYVNSFAYSRPCRGDMV